MNLTERNIVTNQLNLFLSGYKMSDKRLKTTQTRGVRVIMEFNVAVGIFHPFATTDKKKPTASLYGLVTREAASSKNTVPETG